MISAEQLQARIRELEAGYTAALDELNCLKDVLRHELGSPNLERVLAAAESLTAGVAWKRSQIKETDDEG